MTPVSPSLRQMSIERLLSSSFRTSVSVNKAVMDDKARETFSQPKQDLAQSSTATGSQKDVTSRTTPLQTDFLPVLYRAEGGTQLLLSPDSPQLECGVMSGTPMRTAVSRPWDRPLLSPSPSPSLRSVSDKQGQAEQADETLRLTPPHGYRSPPPPLPRLITGSSAPQDKTEGKPAAAPLPSQQYPTPITNPDRALHHWLEAQRLSATKGHARTVSAGSAAMMPLGDASSRPDFDREHMTAMPRYSASRPEGPRAGYSMDHFMPVGGVGPQRGPSSPMVRPRLAIHPYATPPPHLVGHLAEVGAYPPGFASLGSVAAAAAASARWVSPATSLRPTNSIKGPRKRADDVQLMVLNQVFERTAYPSTEERDALARQLGMTSRSVQIWFQNRRRSVKVERQSAIQRAEADAIASQARARGLPGPPYLNEAYSNMALQRGHDNL